MEYESSKEPLPTNFAEANRGKNHPPEKVKEITDMLKEGQRHRDIAAKTGVSPTTVTAINKRNQQEQDFNVSAWKKNTSRLMAEIVTRGSERLLEEIDDIPLSSLPIAIAIMTDKHQQLQDAPTVVVEHRLRIKHEDINSLIKGEIIDIPPVDLSDKKD